MVHYGAIWNGILEVGTAKKQIKSTHLRTNREDLHGKF